MRFSFTRFFVVALAAALACSSCSGGMRLNPAAQSYAPSFVPALGPQAHAGKGVHFVVTFGAGEPAHSMEIQVWRVGGLAPVAARTLDITAKKNGCTATQCSTSVDLPAWDYWAAISTYAGTKRTGKTLSSGQAVAFTSAASGTTVDLTLDGTLASVEVAPGALGVTSTQASGLTIDGTRPLPLIAMGLDPAKAFIVGAGAPSFSATISGSGWKVTQPVKDAPDTLHVTSPSKKGSATLDVNGTQGKHKASAHVKLVNHLQTLMAFEGSLGTIVYAPPYTGTPASNTNGTCSDPLSAHFDGSSNLYVSASCESAGSEEMVKFAPPYSGEPTATFGKGTLGPPGESSTFVVNSGGDVFATPYESFDYDVTEFEPPYTAPPVTIGVGTLYPAAYALNAKNDLFVQSSGFGSNPPAVVEYAPPYTGTAIATISAGMPRAGSPGAIGLDPAGNLFAFGLGSDGYVVAIYAPPYKAGPSMEISGSSIPENVSSMTVDAAGNVFLFAPDQNEVVIYTAPYTGSPIVVSASGNEFKSMALDLADNLYLGHYYDTGPASSTVTAQSPPFKGAAYLTITKGLQYATGAYGPSWITLTP
ncbi:MAG TPA: hypothetical protein VMF61_09265 [Candidatus Acidoferrales bacterium]|nr:hypothetical protein [Candidatus Acidoferrales bacterium]